MALARRALLVCLAVAWAAALPTAAGAASKTVWLCKPGLKNDPCTPGLATTRFSPSGQKLGVDNVKATRNPGIDCFYVYPTVSDQERTQATLRIDPEQRSVALYQAARYSRDCRVYAPIYRQITIRGLLNPGAIMAEQRRIVYEDVLGAWREYLRDYNKGRGVVLIGHSQGTYVLRPLIAAEIDRKPSVRRRLVSALLLGGQVLVKKGKDTGGDFENVPACRSRTQLGCVVAFSTFNGPVPADSRFGRPVANALAGTTPPKGAEVLCTNPAALGGGSGRLDPMYPTKPFAPGTFGAVAEQLGAPRPPASTPWYSFPGSYSARCSSAGGANVLQVKSIGGAPKLKPVPDATWGLHLVDANIALGNLSELVRVQAAAYAAAQETPARRR